MLYSVPWNCRFRTTPTLTLYPASSILKSAIAILQLVYSSFVAYMQYEPLIKCQGLSSPFLIAVSHLYMSCDGKPWSGKLRASHGYSTCGAGGQCNSCPSLEYHFSTNRRSKTPAASFTIGLVSSFRFHIATFTFCRRGQTPIYQLEFLISKPVSLHPGGCTERPCQRT